MPSLIELTFLRSHRRHHRGVASFCLLFSRRPENVFLNPADVAGFSTELFSDKLQPRRSLVQQNNELGQAILHTRLQL